MKRNTTRTTVLIATGLALLGAVVFYMLLQPETTAPKLGSVLNENGFVELRPPSNLYAPGTWVEVLQQSPLNLGIICGPLDALGLSGSQGLEVSNSLELSFYAQLSPTFSLDLRTAKSVRANANLDAVHSVHFNLSNIKLMELPDAVAINGYQERSPECDQAIRFRLKNENPVSMVKSILIADVEYLVEFDGSANAEIKSKAAKVLAANLGANIEHRQSGKTHLVGQQLVWGIRDDIALAKFGYELGSTGNVQSNRSILEGKGPVTNTDNSKQVRRIFPERTKLVSFDVLPLKQTSSMGCWATVYTMLKSWKDGRSWTVSEAVSDLGSQYLDTYVQNSGLPGGSELQFVEDAEMLAEPPANYSLTGFNEMLSNTGPLWITLGDGINSHALLLIGIYGKKMEESAEAYETAIFEFIDPLTGGFTYRPAIEFMQDFEREVAVIVMASADDVPLRWQILHWPEL